MKRKADVKKKKKKSTKKFPTGEGKKKNAPKVKENKRGEKKKKDLFCHLFIGLIRFEGYLKRKTSYMRSIRKWNIKYFHGV